MSPNTPIDLRTGAAPEDWPAQGRGRPVARQGHRTGCPVHPISLIIEGSDQVVVDGLPAAREFDRVLCVPIGAAAWADHSANLITTGYGEVLIDGNPVARKFDLTNYGGLVIEGSGNVFVGPPLSEQETTEVALRLIECSAFGRTPRGQQIAKKLRELQAANKIDYSCQENAWGGRYKDGGIAVDPDLMSDPNYVASIFVHEGTHAVNHDDPCTDPLTQEKEAWDNEAAYFDETKNSRFVPDDDPTHPYYEGQVKYGQMDNAQRWRFLRKKYPPTTARGCVKG